MNAQEQFVQDKINEVTEHLRENLKPYTGINAFDYECACKAISTNFVRFLQHALREDKPCCHECDAPITFGTFCIGETFKRKRNSVDYAITELSIKCSICDAIQKLEWSGSDDSN